MTVGADTFKRAAHPASDSRRRLRAVCKSDPSFFKAATLAEGKFLTGPEDMGISHIL